MLGDADEANDLLQDLFLKLYDRIKNYRFEAPFAAWFYRMAVNLCQDRLRARSRRHRILWHARNPSPNDWHPPPQTELLAAEQERNVRQALMEIHPRYRVCLILREIEDCSYEEIAAILDLSVGTVRSRLSRGRNHLRRLLLSQKR
jgi:RNA polymerase sigma-70 factor (ECF subfamily)